MPDDSTPHGGEALHPLPDRATIPTPPPGREGDAPPRGQPLARGDAAIRPELPTETQRTAADIEDEDADPVVDSGPGIASDDDGKPSVTRQPGG
jgi:hypothetical protein